MKFLFAAVAAFVLSFPLMSLADPATGQTVVKDAVKGTMNITFNTRTNLDTTGKLKPKSAALGAKDQYVVGFTINNTVQFNGDIARQPNLYSSILAKRKQSAQLYYNLTVGVVNPKDNTQKKTVGKWVGTVPINTDSGAFVFDGGAASDSPCRFDIDAVGSQHAFKDLFSGNLMGKAEKKETLASYTMKRWIGGREVAMTIKRSDPMKFENLQLARGPSDNYPRSTANGTLNYDYETGNYFADNIRLTYGFDGADVTDTISGTIKWIEDKDRKANGKGHYEFNLRWNEEKNKKPEGEEAAFKKLSDEDAFFVVDPNAKSLTGTIEYVDTFAGDVVASSKVEYHLDAAGLTKQQVMSFIKLWLSAIGPTNDD